MRSIRPVLLLSLPILLNACATSPPDGSSDGTSEADRRAVLAVVERFFDVMSSRDVERAERLLIPEGVFVNIRTLDGRRVVRHFANADWVLELGDGGPEWREAWDGEPRVLLDGDVAVVWGRYTFDVDGKHSHGGADAFCLVRTEQGWKLAGGVYSVER